MIELIRNAGAVAEESYWLFDAAVAGRVRDFFMTADTSAAVNAYRLEHSLQEMAQSVEHMQAMLKRSPMVQALAQHKPEVRAPSAFLPQAGDMDCILYTTIRRSTMQ